MKQMGLSWWFLLTLIPTFIPFGTVGARCWNDGE